MHEAKGNKQLISDKKKTQKKNSAMLDATAHQLTGSILLPLMANDAMALVSQVANDQIPAAQTSEVQVGRKQFCIKQFCRAKTY